MRAGGRDYVTKPSYDTFIERARSLIQRNPMIRSESVLGISDECVRLSHLRRVCDLTSPLLITVKRELASKSVPVSFTVSHTLKEPFLSKLRGNPSRCLGKRAVRPQGSGSWFSPGFASVPGAGFCF